MKSSKGLGDDFKALRSGSHGFQRFQVGSHGFHARLGILGRFPRFSCSRSEILRPISRISERFQVGFQDTGTLEFSSYLPLDFFESITEF